MGPLEVNLQQLLALHRPALFVGQRGDDLTGLHVDNLTRRGVGQRAVDAERHPARLVAELDAGDLLRRQCGQVEEVQMLVRGVADPDFLLIGSQSDAVARAAVALDRALLEPGDLHAMQHLASLQVPDLEAEELVDRHEAQGLRSVDGERANGGTERADRASCGVRGGVGHRQQRRPESREVARLPIRAEDGVVGFGIRSDPGQDRPGRPVDDVPELLLKRRQVDRLPIRRDGHPVAATRILAVPENLVGPQIDALHGASRTDIEATGVGTGTNALHIVGHAVGSESHRRDAADELVAMVDVEHEQAVPAVLEIVPYSGNRNIEQPLRRLSGSADRGDPASREQPQSHQTTDSHRHRKLPMGGDLRSRGLTLPPFAGLEDFSPPASRFGQIYTNPEWDAMPSQIWLT